MACARCESVSHDTWDYACPVIAALAPEPLPQAGMRCGHCQTWKPLDDMRWTNMVAPLCAACWEGHPLDPQAAPGEVEP